MSYCVDCSREIPQGEIRCAVCAGNVQVTSPVQTDSVQQENEALDKLSLRLRFQSLAWKIGGFVSIAITVLFIVYGVIYLALGGYVMNGNSSYDSDFVYGSDNWYYSDDYYSDYYEDYYSDYYDDYSYENPDDAFFGAFFLISGITFIVAGLVLYIPTIIINFIMSKKVASYRDNIYTDCTDAVAHSANAGNIVLGVFFNPGAFVFAIINLTVYNSNKEVFERIKAHQQAYNQQYTNR